MLSFLYTAELRGISKNPVLFGNHLLYLNTYSTKEVAQKEPFLHLYTPLVLDKLRCHKVENLGVATCHKMENTSHCSVSAKCLMPDQLTKFTL